MISPDMVATDVDSTGQRMFNAPRVMTHQQRVVVYGGTFWPFCNHHRDAIAWLRGQGDLVLVAPSMGHEHKGDTAATYMWRKALVGIGIAGTGAKLWPVEEMLYTEVGMPVYAYDILVKTADEWTGGDAERVAFAVGPDIDVRSWLGYPQIVSAGFEFVHMPPAGPGGSEIHASQIREWIRSQDPRWYQHVPSEVASAIVRWGLLGSAPKPTRRDLTYLS